MQQTTLYSNLLGSGYNIVMGRIDSSRQQMMHIVCICAVTLAATSCTRIPGVSSSPGQVHKLPEGLTASVYLKLGRKYKASGWTEEAREALKKAIELDQGEIGMQAKTYLDAYIPRHTVGKEAERQNILGYNKMAQGDTEGAIKIFKECIEQYPKFEWPYGNLGSIYTEQGKISEAKEVLNKALEINPNYVNGWLHLAEARLKEKDIEGAREALNKAAAIDPDSTAVKSRMSEITEASGQK